VCLRNISINSQHKGDDDDDDDNNNNNNNNRSNWNHLKITRTIPEQHIRKARNQETTKNSHIGHCIHTAENTNVKAQNIFHARNNTICGTNREYRTVATVCTYTRNKVCFTYIIVNSLNEGGNKYNNNNNNINNNSEIT
jgi:hypothetical protein